MYFRDVRKRREKLKNLEKSNIHSRFRRIRSGHDQGLGRGMKNTDQGISSCFHVLTIRFEVTVRSVRWSPTTICSISPRGSKSWKNDNFMSTRAWYCTKSSFT